MTINQIAGMNPAGISGVFPQVADTGAKTSQATGASFGDFLSEAIQEVNQMQVEADKSIDTLTTGESKDIHQTMIAMEKADISLQLMVQTRDKAVEAYKQLMQMSV